MPTADRVFTENGAIRQPGNDIARTVGEMIAAGKIIGTYLGPMEYGPRALGARSIMAPAIDRSINDWLNKRLDRTDFMPFAPVVRAERARDVFELSDSVLYAAQFMTVTCDVKPEWRGRVPAITHVDGTARPQVIHRRQNPVYYDALASYEALTGLPVVINTSFNVHDEPIINKPDEAWIALRDGRVDYVTTDTAPGLNKAPTLKKFERLYALWDIAPAAVEVVEVASLWMTRGEIRGDTGGQRTGSSRAW